MARLENGTITVAIPPSAVEHALGGCLSVLREQMIAGEYYRITGELYEDGSMILRAELTHRFPDHSVG